MAINDEIAAGGRPVQFENPLNNMVKMYSIKNDMQTNQMNQMKMAETERAQAQAEDTRNFFRTPGLNIENMTPTQKQMLASKDPALFEKLMTQQSTQKTQESESAKRAVETRGIYADHYGNEFSKLTTPQEAASLVSSMYDNVHMKGSPIHGVTKEQALARIPQDVNSPEWLKYIQQNSLNAKDYAQSQLLEFKDMGGANQGFNRTSGLPQGPSTAKGLTPEQELTAVPGQAKLVAEYNQADASIKNLLAKANDPANAGQATQLLADASALSKSNELRGAEIARMQGQGAQSKHASAEFLQVNARLEQLRAAGQQDSPEGKALQARIAKETNIPQADESVVVRTTTDNDGTVHFYNRFGAELRSQRNAGKTAPDSLAGPEKRMPAHILETVAKNNAAVANIDNALKQVSLYPSGFGAQAYLPDAILQRTDPNGVTARATVANIGSLKIHDRSGAAVTVGETPRLRPFIPAVNDAPETVVKKLKELRREMLVMDKEYKKTLTEQGYRTGSPAEAGATRTGATVSNWN